MHRIICLLLPLVLIAALLAGCTAGGGTSSPPDGPEEVDGARYDRTDPDAPKVIQSTQIVSFECRFTTLGRPDEAAPDGPDGLAQIPTMGRQACHLSAKMENGAVIGLYEYRTGTRTVSRPFRAGHDFLNELQGLVGDAYDLAQYNGHDVEVKGLPDEYGGSLEVVYASGETIRAYDNEADILTGSAMSALDWLFAQSSAVPPEAVPLSANHEAWMDRSEDGGFREVQYPALTLGYALSDGEPVRPDGYADLAAAIDAWNAQERELADRAKARLTAAAGRKDLYSVTEAVICRSDDELLSFYETTRSFESADQEREEVRYRTCVLDPGTGKPLGFADVFRDMQLLPSAISSALAQAYPEQTFREDEMDVIVQSVLSDDGQICFAPGYGCVHIFINEHVLNDEPGGQRVTVGYVEQPYLVRPFYTSAPLRGIMPLEYGVPYRLTSCLGFRMECRPQSGREGVLWTLDTEDGHHSEAKLSGAAPACYLVWDSGRYMLYRRVSAGDVSYRTDVLELSEQGVIPRGQLQMALDPATACDPDRLTVILNEIVSWRGGSMIPGGICRLSRGDMLPEFVGGVYDLRGNPGMVRSDCRVNPPSREQAAVSGGMWNLFAGDLLTPWQTDMTSWIIFRTEDGRLCRFEIDGFTDGMHLDNFGTLDEFFLPAGKG